MVSFSKYHGCGNDFILIDDRLNRFPKDPHLIARLCHRQFGIGADGLILLHSSQRADFQMVYFNSDGKTAGMCGNGLRCLIHFIREKQVSNKMKLSIEVGRQIFQINGHEICFPLPKILFLNAALPDYASVHGIDSGVPHLILFVEQIDQINVKEEGRKLRNVFFPENGMNVSFATIENQNRLCLRTYERGVEDETLACGTAAIAATFAAYRSGFVAQQVKVIPRSGYHLNIAIDKEHLILSGPVCAVFKGEINP